MTIENLAKELEVIYYNDPHLIDLEIKSLLVNSQYTGMNAAEAFHLMLMIYLHLKNNLTPEQLEEIHVNNVKHASIMAKMRGN